ncbi:MAG: hypothetical protein R6V44_03340 [Paracoccaceae bacterium]
MSKKSFTAAPRPKPIRTEDIEAFESGGAGHDRRAGPAAVPDVRRPPAEPTKRLSLDLPASVHTRFKTACSATGRKMVSEVLDLIERRTSELEAEAGISRE